MRHLPIISLLPCGEVNGLRVGIAISQPMRGVRAIGPGRPRLGGAARGGFGQRHFAVDGDGEATRARRVFALVVVLALPLLSFCQTARHGGHQRGRAGPLRGQPCRLCGAFTGLFYGVLQALAPGVGGRGPAVVWPSIQDAHVTVL